MDLRSFKRSIILVLIHLEFQNFVAACEMSQDTRKLQVEITDHACHILILNHPLTSTPAPRALPSQCLWPADLGIHYYLFGPPQWMGLSPTTAEQIKAEMKLMSLNSQE